MFASGRDYYDLDFLLSDKCSYYSAYFLNLLVGIPKPKFGEIDAPLVLDLMEGIYLLDKKIISIYAEKKKQNYENMLKICRDEYHEFDKKYAVYEHFREKNYIINPGIKFGCDFAVYERGPGIDQRGINFAEFWLWNSNWFTIIPHGE